MTTPVGLDNRTGHSPGLPQHDVLSAVGRFTLHELPALNARIIGGRGELPQLVGRMNHLLAGLPDPGLLLPADTQRLIVELGIWGSSVQRHALDQQAAPDALAGLDLLRAGPGGELPFREYFRTLATRSGTGHPPRDAYASLVRWNTPPSQAVWNGERIVALPSVYRDGLVRTYTADAGETLILELFKAVETLEAGANTALEPVWAGCSMSDDEATHRFTIATHMVAGAQRLFRDFPGGDHRGALSIEHFIHVFRQFGVHWQDGDTPPSGPQDVEWVTRDLMTGVGSPAYCQHVRRIYPGLLAPERARLSQAMDRPPLPQQLLQAAGLTAQVLTAMPEAELSETARNHPRIVACYYFLRASARLSAIHLAVSKHYLFAAMRRADTGHGQAAVSNEQGITGLAEQALERLHHARQHHALHPLGRLPRPTLRTLSHIVPDPQTSTSQALALLGRQPPADESVRTHPASPGGERGQHALGPGAAA